MTSVPELERGRASYAGHAWSDAFDALSAADGVEPLDGDHLELLATAAYMLGRESEYLELLARAHGAHLEAQRPAAALRCAFWIGVHRARRGELGRAGGWLARAQRLLDGMPGDTVDRGYLLIPTVFEHSARGDLEAAAATAGEAAAIGERFGDRDLFALAAHEQGHLLVEGGRLEPGLALLDEAMLSVTSGEVSPIVAGIVYCGVILACQRAYDVRRAQEWTAALTSWCDAQPGLVAFTGRCLVHRAEILELHGAWSEALAETRRAAERSLEAENDAAAGEARYREGEIHRLRGDLAAAEDAYRAASGLGREPQPGLALLRLAQGRRAAALGAIRRVLEEATDFGRRVPALRAAVEIALAAGEPGQARAACGELEAIAAGQRSAVLEAVVAGARGSVELADGAAGAALVDLRRACELWSSLDAPYEAARARSSLAHACAELGDGEAAAMERELADAALAQLDAAPLSARPDAHGLTQRELQVLGLVAAGASNREVAERLTISEHTVARHLQNVFAKLGVSSRTAATAFALEHGLL